MRCRSPRPGTQVLAAVVRHERDRVAEHIAALDPDVLIVDQDDIPGTGRAVEAALEALGRPGWTEPWWSPTGTFRC